MGVVKDLLNHKFGKYTVIDFVGLNDRNQAVWKCICECGTIKDIPARSLVHDRVMSCGCYLRERIQETHRKPYGVAALHSTYSSYIKGARNRNIVFNLSLDEFKEITQKNCFYCNDAPSNKTSLDSGVYTYNGVDRIDNKQGYHIDNVVPCCYICNRAKLTLPQEEFIQWIKRLVKYNKNI